MLPLEADEKLEALKHYFGVTYDDELVTRGIETRRHDTSKFIKDFQRELLYTLFDANSTTEIIDRTLENALFCVTKTIDKIMTGEIEPASLIISKQLRMDITEYRSLFPHVAAAIQLSKTNGKAPSRGDIIEYIYTDSQHQNPLNRVVTGGASDNYFGLEYDKEKYKEMLPIRTKSRYLEEDPCLSIRYYRLILEQIWKRFGFRTDQQEIQGDIIEN